MPVTEVEEEATKGLSGPVVPGRNGSSPASGATPTDPPSATTATAALAGGPEELAEHRPSTARTVLVAALTLLVLAGLAFGAYRLLAGSGTDSVTVPTVLGSTRAAAEQTLIDAGLQPAFRNVDGPDDASVGKVIRQAPGEGTDVARGSTVTAEINVGPATERIPEDLVGRELDDVLAALADAGFTSVTSVPVANPPAGSEPDEVLGIVPGEGEKAAPQEDITVSYAGRAVRAPTTGSRDQPGGGSSRPAERESSDDQESGEASESSEAGESSAPSEEETTEEPSSEPSESDEPEPSDSASAEPEPSESAGTGPSAEPSDPPSEEPEDPPASADPAEASVPPAGTDGDADPSG